MMIPIGAYVAVLLLSVIVIVGGFYLVLKGSSSGFYRDLGKRGIARQDGEPEADGAQRPRRGGRRGLQRMRRRRRGAAAEEEDLDDGEEDGDGAREVFDTIEERIAAESLDKGKKIGKKKMAKLAAKEERRQAREAFEAEKERRRLQEERELADLEAKRKKEAEEEKLMMEQLAKDEEKRRLVAEAKEKEEYDQWKDMFSVEDEGTDTMTEEEAQKERQQFIDYVKEKKLVQLEDLAVKFSMRTADVVERLQQMDESQELPGIIDDRGKFIHITSEELEDVATFIERRGRITIEELTRYCNKAIHLGDS